MRFSLFFSALVLAASYGSIQSQNPTLQTVTSKTGNTIAWVDSADGKTVDFTVTKSGANGNWIAIGLSKTEAMSDGANVVMCNSDNSGNSLVEQYKVSGRSLVPLSATTLGIGLASASAKLEADKLVCTFKRSKAVPTSGITVDEAKAYLSSADGSLFLINAWGMFMGGNPAAARKFNE
jgi:hypothetical protein